MGSRWMVKEEKVRQEDRGLKEKAGSGRMMGMGERRRGDKGMN